MKENDDDDGFVSPLDNDAFKLIFGNQENIGITSAFLKTLLDIPEEEYGGLALSNPILGKSFTDEKMSIVDVLLSTKSGKKIHIELQVRKGDNFKNRIQYYADRLIVDQIRSGDDYIKLRQVISIIICNHKLLDEEDAYINAYELKNEKNRCFSDLSKIIIIELPKLPEKKDSAAWPWLSFLKCEKREELEMLRIEYPELEKPVFCAEKMSWLEKRRNIQFHKNLMKIDRRQILLQERIEGRAEEKVEIARKMKEAGDSIEKIHTITGLSLDEIEKL